MPISLFNIQPLLPAISENSLILTPNSRLKNKLVEAYNQHQQDLGHHHWRSPRAYSLAQWVSEQFQLLLDGANISEPRAELDDFSERLIWLDIVETDSSGAELINPLKLASDAQSAYKTLLRWNLNPCALQQGQPLPLENWSREFESRLEALNLTTREHIQQALCSALEQGTSEREQEVVLVGFDDIAPLTQTLLNKLSDRLTPIDPLNHKTSESRCVTAAYASSEEEINAAARWAVEKLHHNCDAVIGIISPELGQIRQKVERIFVEVFEPHYALPETGRYTLPFNFSAGIPLGNTAFVRDTLSLLQLNFHQSSIELFNNLLMSPFWSIPQSLSLELSRVLNGGIRETMKTSQLRQLVHSQTLPKREADTAQIELWTELDTQLQDIESMRRQAGRSMSAPEWISLFERQLRKLGWPGSRRLDSNEFQQMNQWYELLERFAFLDQLGKPFSLREALDNLSQLASGVHFQPQTPESPVQVLGVLEGAGLQFSDCWVMGLSQQNWPPAPEPNALIPLNLQRELGMPHADATRELDYAERLTAGYQRCADQIVFSYPLAADGNPLHKSSLLESIDSCTIEQSTPVFTGWTSYYNTLTSPLEWVNTGVAPPVTESELSRLRGGSQIFKNQAISPFAAFALHRLRAVNHQQPAVGFSAIQRGEILHDALSDIWKSLKTHAQLVATPKPQLSQKVIECVAEQVKKFTRREPDVFGETYAQLEIHRQSQLIEAWLATEIERQPFAVAANEESIKISFAGLPLNLRLDRMDRLESGELVLIDYKTGTPNTKSWGSDRPEEPQLPLYCLCYNQDIDAILFAQVNAKEIAYKGLGELTQSLDGVIDCSKAQTLDLPSNWSEIQDHWRNSLEQLAEEFLQGDCSLEFKSPATKRFYQDLAPIMRWQEEQDIRQALTTNTHPGADL
jgi:ATP-dependent helicase/nuclease subunit B